MRIRIDTSQRSRIKTLRFDLYGNSFKNFLIRNNVLDRSVTDLLRIQFSKKEYNPGMYGNTYILGTVNDLCTFGYGNGITYPGDVSAAARLNMILEDHGAKLYFTDRVPYYSYNYTSYYNY